MMPIMYGRPHASSTALPLIGALIVVSLALGLGGLTGSASARSSALQAGQIGGVFVDADITLPGIQSCRSVSVGDSVAVDLIVDAIDPADGSLDGGGLANAGLRYTDAPLDLSTVAAHPDSPWAAGSLLPGEEAALGDGTKQIVGYTVLVFPADRPEFSGVQPVFRVTFSAVAAGVATVNVGNSPGYDDTRDFVVSTAASGQAVKNFDPFDDDGDGFSIDSRQGAFIAVGEPCPQEAPQSFPDEPTTQTLGGVATPGGTDGAAPNASEPDGQAPQPGLPNGGGEPPADGDTAGRTDAVEDADAGEPQGGPEGTVSEPGGDGTDWALVAVVVGGIGALGLGGAAWWGLRRRGAHDRGSD